MPIIEWEEMSKSGKRVWKQKVFYSQEEEDKYVAKLIKKENFCEIIAGR